MRLDYEGIGQNLDKSQKLWIYKHRFNPDREMVPVYCFPDFEFLPTDIEVGYPPKDPKGVEMNEETDANIYIFRETQSMNFEPMLDPRTIFAHKVMCVRFTTDREKTNEDDDQGPGSPGAEALEGGEIDGSLTLNHDVLKWRRHGKVVVKLTFKDEAERVDALKRYFGVTLREEDRESICGTIAQVGLVSGGPP